MASSPSCYRILRKPSLFFVLGWASTFGIFHTGHLRYYLNFHICDQHRHGIESTFCIGDWNFLKFQTVILGLLLVGCGSYHGRAGMGGLVWLISLIYVCAWVIRFNFKFCLAAPRSSHTLILIFIVGVLSFFRGCVLRYSIAIFDSRVSRWIVRAWAPFFGYCAELSCRKISRSFHPSPRI